MKIYIASFFDTRERLRPIRDRLWKLGHEVVSSWIDEAPRVEGMTEDEFFRKTAIKDLAEVKQADLLIVDTLDVSPRGGGGREVEYGFALGHFQTKLTYHVGPIRNIFHWLADKHFDTWEDCLAFLSSALMRKSWLDLEPRPDELEALHGGRPR